MIINAEITRDDSDRQLLERFIAQRDEAAFAGLVERHGRTVWGMCRRVLQHEQDAEDAYQAVFLTLARSAASIRQREAVGCWLYGVAGRTALKARQISVRHKDHERKAAAEAPQGQPPWSEAACRELQRILDEEVQRLAEKYRAPFVLCCLEGMSKAEAAKELDWKEGTVSGRLSQARKLLQSRLGRRGVSLSAVLTVVALAQQTAAAAAPAVLVQGTIQAVLAPLAGEITAGSALAPSVIALAEGTVPTLAAAKLKVGLLVATAAALVSGLSLAALQLGQPGAAVQPQVPGGALAFVSPPVPLFKPIDELVFTVTFSPDGTKLITAGGMRKLPGQIKIWDIPGGKELAKVRGIGGVRTVAFSPDGNTFAAGDYDGAIKLRDADTGAEKASVIGHVAGVHGVNGLAFSADGTSLVSVGLDKIVKLWDAKGLKERKAFVLHTHMILSVAYFRHGEGFVTGSNDNTAKIWDIHTGKEKFTLRGHKSAVEMVAVAPDDKTVATASWDGTIKLWNAETGEETGMLIASKSPIFAVAFSRNGKLLASAGADGAICLWEVKTRELVKVLGQHPHAVWSVAFSRDDQLLASGSADTTAKLWDLNETREIATLKTAELRPIQALAYSADGKTVAMATDDNAVRVCDTRTGNVQVVPTGHGDVVTCVAFSRDGKMLATGSADKTVKLHDQATGKQTTLLGHTGAVHAVAFTPDGTKLASAGADKTIKIWDAATGAASTNFEGHEAAVGALAFAPDGRTLASGSVDQTVRLWDLDKETEALTLKAHAATVRAVAFSDGFLASASDEGAVKLWQADMGKPFKLAPDKEPLDLRGHARGACALAFAPDGRTLFSGGQDKTVIVWDTMTGQARQILNEHKGAVTALAVHPLASDLISGGLDNMLIRWPRADALPPVKTVYQDCRNKRPLLPSFTLVGPDTEGETKAEDEGLRITLAAARVAHWPTEVTTTFTIVGDFEITGTYEFLAGERPTKGYGVGVHLNIADNENRIKFAKICRALMPNVGSVHLAQYWHSKKDSHVRHKQTEAKAGQLRLTRVGASLRYLVSDAPGQEFREIWFQEDFGREDIEHLRFGVSDSGEAGNPVDARLVDLKIRMGGSMVENVAFEPAPLAAPAPLEDADASPDGTEAATWTRSSLARAWFLGLGMWLALGLGVWGYLRHRRRSLELAAPAQISGQHDKPEGLMTLAFVCSACGKKLKVNAGLAGRKVKCPHCGKAESVPAAPTDERKR